MFSINTGMNKIIPAILDWLSRVVDFFERYWYIVPAYTAIALVIAVSYLLNASLTAANQLEQNIQQIPQIVQMEMTKTRDTLHDEGEADRLAIQNQHTETREQLEKQLEASELQRRELRLELDQMQKKINTIPTKPPRQKVFGIF
jgi:hypothetical protein